MIYMPRETYFILRIGYVGDVRLRESESGIFFSRVMEQFSYLLWLLVSPENCVIFYRFNNTINCYYYSLIDVERRDWEGLHMFAFHANCS